MGGLRDIYLGTEWMAVTVTVTVTGTVTGRSVSVPTAQVCIDTPCYSYMYRGSNTLDARQSATLLHPLMIWVKSTTRTTKTRIKPSENVELDGTSTRLHYNIRRPRKDQEATKGLPGPGPHKRRLQRLSQHLEFKHGERP